MMIPVLRTLIGVSVIILVSASVVLAASLPFRVEVPDSVGVGQPFLVRVSSKSAMDTVAIDWQGRNFRSEVREGGDSSVAITLLGTNLNAALGHHPLLLVVNVEGTPYFLWKQIRIVEHAYQKETLSVDPKMVVPPEAVRERLKRERKIWREVLQTETPERRWELPLSLPVNGKRLSRYGLYRVFNGEAKRRHRGLDFRAWEGTPIRAISPGTVIFSGPMYFAGNCIIIDHGNGLLSASMHLSRFLVRKGDVVEAGRKIGLAGSTGRVNGAHLHLSVFTHGKQIDPEPLFDNGEDGLLMGN